MRIKEEDITKLKAFYTIRGDGVAHVRLDKLTKSKEFQASLERLASYSQTKTNKDEEIAPAQ